MKVTWRQFVKAYSVDFRKRRLLYVIAGFLLSGLVMDGLKWKSNFTDWFLILPAIVLMPLAINSLVAIYRITRQRV